MREGNVTAGHTLLISHAPCPVPSGPPPEVSPVFLGWLPNALCLKVEPFLDLSGRLTSSGESL